MHTESCWLGRKDLDRLFWTDYSKGNSLWSHTCINFSLHFWFEDLSSMLVCLISNLEQFLFSFHEYLYALCLFFSLFCFLHPLHTYLASTSIAHTTSTTSWNCSQNQMRTTWAQSELKRQFDREMNITACNVYSKGIPERKQHNSKQTQQQRHHK